MAPDTFPWFVWRKANDRLIYWVDTLIPGRHYTASFTPHEGSHVDFIKREIAVDPVMFDDQVRPAMLPLMWGTAKLARRSQVQVYLSRAAARHEAGHVLFTTEPKPHDPVIGWLTNALEDERMERLTAAYYAPAALDFQLMSFIAHGGGMDWYNSPDGMVLMNACLFHRHDHRAMSRVLNEAPFASRSMRDHWHTWDTRVRPLVEQAWIAPDTKRVIEIATEIKAIIFPKELKSHEKREISAKIEREKNKSDMSSTERGTSDAPVMPGTAPLETDPESETHEGELERTGEHMRSDDASDHLARVLPYLAIERELRGEIHRVTARLLVPTRDAEDIANNIRGRFQTRAFARSHGERPVVRKDGDDLAPHGLDVIILIDGSSSMGNADEQWGMSSKAMRAAMILERACAAAGVPLAIARAGSSIGKQRGKTVKASVRKLNTAGFEDIPDQVTWLKTFETPANSEVPRAQLAGYQTFGGDESVSISLRIADAVLFKRRQSGVTNIPLVLTMHDGHPTDETMDDVRRTVTALRAKGTTIVSIALTEIGDGDEEPTPEEIEMNPLVQNLQYGFGKGSLDVIAVPDMRLLAARLGRLIDTLRRRS